MNGEIYTGRNSIENWLITQRTSGSAARDFTRKSDPNRIVVDEKSTRSAVKDTSYLIKNIGNDTSAVVSGEYDSDKWERIGGLIGAAAFAGIYSLTYPITFIDGPLPIVDAAWAFGLVRFTRSGHTIGSEVGSWLD